MGEQVIPQVFINNLLAGNNEVKSAWAKGKEALMAPDAWYKDQIHIPLWNDSFCCNLTYRAGVYVASI